MGSEILEALITIGSFGLATTKKKVKTPVVSGGAEDKRIVTAKDITKRNARTALVVGSPRGVLSTASISGRGTLLGN